MKFINATRMPSRIVCLENGRTLPKLRAYWGTRKNDTTLKSIKRNFKKSVLTPCDSEIKSKGFQYLYCK